MQLLLNDEQRLLQDSAARMSERLGGPKLLRARLAAPGQLDRAAWAAVAEAGWLAILVPEEAGGLGLGLGELALVAEQAGRALLPLPVAAAAGAASALAPSDKGRARAGLIAAVLAGERIVLPTVAESGHAAPDAAPGLVAGEAGGGAIRLSGSVGLVPAAASADGFVVAARGPTGMVACHVARDAPGLAVTPAATIDGSGHGRLAFDDVEVAGDDVLAGPNRAPALVALLADRLAVAVGAELLGVMEGAHRMALDYLKVREQFGRPIGSFQALQHRAVDDHLAVETLRSLVYQAAALDAGRGGPALAAAVMAKATDAALRVCKSAIQLHGAIGFTDEHDVGLHLKRAMTLAALYGNATVQRRRYARLAAIG